MSFPESVPPALALSACVGLFHLGVWVAIRASAGGWSVLLVALLAVLGAWTGDAISQRTGPHLLHLGDYHLLGGSLGAWAGIGAWWLIGVLGDRSGSR